MGSLPSQGSRGERVTRVVDTGKRCVQEARLRCPLLCRARPGPPVLPVFSQPQHPCHSVRLAWPWGRVARWEKWSRADPGGGPGAVTWQLCCLGSRRALGGLPELL